MRKIPRAKLEAEHRVLQKTLIQINATLRDIEMIVADVRPGAVPSIRSAYLLGEAAIGTSHDARPH